MEIRAIRAALAALIIKRLGGKSCGLLDENAGLFLSASLRSLTKDPCARRPDRCRWVSVIKSWSTYFQLLLSKNRVEKDFQEIPRRKYVKASWDFSGDRRIMSFVIIEMKIHVLLVAQTGISMFRFLFDSKYNSRHKVSRNFRRSSKQFRPSNPWSILNYAKKAVWKDRRIHEHRKTWHVSNFSSTRDSNLPQEYIAIRNSR